MVTLYAFALFFAGGILGWMLSSLLIAGEKADRCSDCQSFRYPFPNPNFPKKDLPENVIPFPMVDKQPVPPFPKAIANGG
jgi:hypothetical protein